MIESRAVDWRLPVTLGAIVVIDQLIDLGALGAAPRSTAPLGPRLLAGLLTVVALSGVLVLARWTWLRSCFAQRRPSVGILSVALAVQVGLSVSRNVLVAEGMIERQPGLALDEFVFLTATTIVVLLVLAALGRHRDLMADITRTTAHLAAAHAVSTSGVVEERARLAGQVRVLLEERLGPTSMRTALFTPERLRTIADDVLRPLSHRLARTPVDVARSAPRGRRERLSVVLRALRPMPVLRPGLLAATMALLVFRFSVTPPPPELLGSIDAQPGTSGTSAGGMPELVISVRWASLLESLGLHVATVLVVLLGTRRLARWLAARGELEQRAGRTGGRLGAGRPIRAWTVTVLALGGLGLLSLLLLRIVFGLPGFLGLPPLTPGAVIGFTAPLVLITVVLSVLRAAEDALASTRAQLVAANQELAAATARASALLDHERRLFARHLHASVQAAVNAASLAIERATADGTVDPDVITRAAATIDAAVEHLHERPSTSEHGVEDGSRDLDARLAAIVATWEPLADIDVHLDAATRGRLTSDPVARATLCDLLAEACANAVIHGRAARIVVDVELLVSDGAGALSLRVADDGHASSPQRREGLGSHILATSCTAWDLEHREDGTTLTASLPVR